MKYTFCILKNGWVYNWESIRLNVDTYNFIFLLVKWWNSVSYNPKPLIQISVKHLIRSFSKFFMHSSLNYKRSEKSKVWSMKEHLEEKNGRQKWKARHGIFSLINMKRLFLFTYVCICCKSSQGIPLICWGRNLF